MTIVKRDKEAEADAGHPFHHLQCSIPWLEDAISATRESLGTPWRFYTRAARLRDRRDRMNEHLWMKREYGVIRRAPVYVWVFYNPGLFGFAYQGWWTYLIGSNGVTPYGQYLRRDEETVSRLMELFPLVERTLFGRGNFAQWQIEFAKRYQRGLRGGKPQGKSPVWAEVCGDTIGSLLSRAEWPKRLEAVA